MEKNRNQALGELALLFLKLGSISFGGPAVHIAMMEEEVVVRKKWMTREEFLDRLGASNLIPGPSSTELAIHIGYFRAGWAGLFTAGFCFIFPAFCMVWGLASLYVKFGIHAEVLGVLYGIKPVLLAVILQALWRMGQAALKTRTLAILAAVSFGLSFLKVELLLLLLAAGLAALIPRLVPRKPNPTAIFGLNFSAVKINAMALVAAAVPISLTGLFVYFLKVGFVLFGSGYVLLAFLQADLVDHWHWLTETQLLDAIAVGQATPGPVFATATFIGYLLGRSEGAVLATLGIFLPAFILVAFSGWLVPKIRRSPLASDFLDGVNAGSLALMAWISFQLGSAALVGGISWMLFLVSLFLVFWVKINSIWLVGFGALVGSLSVFIK